MAQMVKNPPAMQENCVWPLSQEDAPEKGMAGYPLQYSCLEKSMDRGVCQAAVYEVTKIQTWLSN